MDTANPQLHIPKESEQTRKEKIRVEQVIEKVATGLVKASDSSPTRASCSSSSPSFGPPLGSHWYGAREVSMPHGSGSATCHGWRRDWCGCSSCR